MQAGANIRDLKTSSYTFVHAHRDCVIIPFVRTTSLMKTKLRRTRFVVFVFKHYSECIILYLKSRCSIVFILYRVSENFRNTLNTGLVYQYYTFTEPVIICLWFYNGLHFFSQFLFKYKPLFCLMSSKISTYKKRSDA